MNVNVPSPVRNGPDLNGFVVTMWIEQQDEVFVRSCEILGQKFRNRTSFGERPTVESAFSERMAYEIKSCLSKLSLRTEVLALPSLRIELPELCLSGARIVATRLANGMVNVIMRFQSFIGRINSAFRDDIGIDTRLDLVNSVMATKVLNDIAMPLLNICTAIDQQAVENPGKLAAMARHLSTQSHEVRFQIELLKRFVSQEPLAAVAEAPVLPSLDDLRFPAAPLTIEN